MPVYWSLSTDLSTYCASLLCSFACHTLIVADAPQSFPELPEPLIFDEAFTSGNRDEERIGGWEKVQELRSGKVTLWDHCFELPHKHLEAEKLIQDSAAAGEVTHKL